LSNAIHSEEEESESSSPPWEEKWSHVIESFHLVCRSTYAAEAHGFVEDVVAATPSHRHIIFKAVCSTKDLAIAEGCEKQKIDYLRWPSNPRSSLWQRQASESNRVDRKCLEC